MIFHFHNSSVENTTKDGQFTREEFQETQHVPNSGNITNCVFISN